jgi:ABC-2 type transport system permease protein
VLVRMRVLDVTRSSTAAGLFMLLPVVLLAVVGLVFANGHPFERRELILVASEGSRLDSLAGALVRFPEVRVEREATEAIALNKLRSRMANAILITGGPQLRLVVGPRDQLFGRGLAEVLPDAPEIEVVELPRWGYVHYLFPGLLTFSVLLAGLFGMGYPMVRYRQNLFLKKLATTPLAKTTFVAAQIAARALLVLAQMALLVAAACVGFALPITVSSSAWLVVFTMLGLLTFMGAGFALAAVIKTEAVIIDVINAVTVPLVLLSEIFFPVSELPAPLPALATLLPSTQMVRLTRSVLLYGVTDARVLLPGVAILAAWTLLTYGTSILVFRWH